MGKEKTKISWVNPPDKEAKTKPLYAGASHDVFNLNLVQSGISVDVGDLLIINDTGSSKAETEPVSLKYEGAPELTREFVAWRVSDQVNVKSYMVYDTEGDKPVSKEITVEYNAENYSFDYRVTGVELQDGHSYYIKARSYSENGSFDGDKSESSIFRG